MNRGRYWPALALLWVAGALHAETHIFIDPKASGPVRHAAEELAADINQVSPAERARVRIFEPGTNMDAAHSIRVGVTGRDSLLWSNAVRDDFPLLEQPLEAETFIIQSVNGDAVIGGADERGVLYGVYEFSRQVLGIDALEYWTSKKAPQLEQLEIPAIAHVEPAPVFELRGYFDNDNDHLANWRGRKLIVEFETWKEVIDSLARLRYNYIDIHDLLGRPEYYLRDYYIQMTEYHTDLDLVERVIDYAHEKGLLVQIPMMLAWEFRHITLDQVCLSEYHDLWMDTWEYYLSESPLRKADIFVVRPRHPIYDWAYKCPSEEAKGIAPGPLIEAAFSGLVELIGKYRPGATLVTDLWQEGRTLFLSGDFMPDKDLQVLWADAGYAEFGGWPTDLKGYAMGIYIHAGVWHNQVVQDPYPARLAKAFSEAASLGMTHNALVNGQSFKPFILNLEAAALAMWNPDAFDPEQYYRDWTTRYFGSAASAVAVRSLERLHEAHRHIPGYRDITKASQKTLRNLSQGKAEPVDLKPVRRALVAARESLRLAREAERDVPAESLDVFDDQLGFPAMIYVQNLEVLESLASLNKAVVNGEDTSASVKSTRKRLQTLLGNLESGSRWKKWSDWYLPENFRIHTPPITLEAFDAVFGQ